MKYKFYYSKIVNHTLKVRTESNLPVQFDAIEANSCINFELAELKTNKYVCRNFSAVCK